jgi:hypothetical protein
MIRRTIEVEGDVELAAVEQALAMVRELKRLADGAPDRHVLAAVESAAVDRGRRFTRGRLQDVLNAQAEDLEKKGGAAGSAPAAGRVGVTARRTGGWSPPPAT